MKKFQILQELANVTQRHEVSQCYWKNAASRLAQRSIAKTLDL